MPIYEYHCLECHQQFDRLRAAPDRDTPVACPACGQTRAKRTLSAFATIRSGGAPAGDRAATPAGGGGCACGGQCRCH